MSKYNYTKQDSDNWRELLGPKVLSGDQTISDRSIELFGQPSTIGHLFKKFPNSDYNNWYSEQGFCRTFLKAGITLSQLKDYHTLLSGKTVKERSVELFNDPLKLGRYLLKYTDYKDNYIQSLRNTDLSSDSFLKWKELLGPDVLSGKISIAERSRQLTNDKSLLYYYLEKYAPDSYKEWIKDYNYDQQLLRIKCKISDFQDWRKILGPVVLSGDIYTKERSIELGGHPCDLHHCLEKYAPSDYFEWYNNQGFAPSLIKANLTIQDLQNWKDLLGIDVLNSNKPIPEYLRQPLVIYGPLSFKNWYCKDYNFTRRFQSNYEISLIDKLKQNYSVCQYNKLSGRHQIDVYLPDLKIGFELNGYYFHSLGHPEDSSVKDNRYYHRDKTTAALQQGIKLYHLWHDGENKSDYDLLDSVVESKINNCPYNFSAGSFNLKEMNHREAQMFFDENHLQGYGVKHKYCWGLYNQKHGIVAAISFGYRNNQLELLRYACKRHYNIKYGFSRLFHHALELLPSGVPIVSYADRDLVPDPYSSVYYRHNFRLVESESIKIPLELNYYVHKSLSGYCQGVYSRQTFQKHKLLELFPESDPTKTELDIAIEHGIYPCFNSGTWKFIYNR